MTDQEIIEDFNFKFNSFFKGLRFIEKSHEYFIDNKKTSISVSGLVKSLIEEPDWDNIAKAIAKRDKKTKESVLAEWALKNKIACDNGTKTHDFAQKLNPDSKPDTNKELAVVKFWDDLENKNPGRYILVGREKEMYHKLYRFPGTCDFILYDKLTTFFIVGDYKTNEDLFKNYKEKRLLPPFDFLLDCPYNHYQVQLSFYQLLIEQLNYFISERWIIYLEQNSDYKKYNCYNYSTHLIDWLDSRIIPQYA